jgi:hypothetical protein
MEEKEWMLLISISSLNKLPQTRGRNESPAQLLARGSLKEKHEDRKDNQGAQAQNLQRGKMIGVQKGSLGVRAFFFLFEWEQGKRSTVYGQKA